MRAKSSGPERHVIAPPTISFFGLARVTLFVPRLTCAPAADDSSHFAWICASALSESSFMNWCDIRSSIDASERTARQAIAADESQGKPSPLGAD